MSIPYNPELAETHKFPINVPSEDHIGSEPRWVTYEEFTCSLAAPMPTVVDDIHHMATGCAGEAGELLDSSKKTWVYKKPLDRANMIEELGDLEWYMANMRQLLGVSRYEILAANIAKLSIRYAAGYSNAAAIERADKIETLTPVGESGLQHFVDEVGQPLQSSKLQIIDMSKGQVAAVDSQVANLSEDDLESMLEQNLPDIQEWTVPLLAAYHAGKTVSAIAYSKNTATVLFVGDPQPYKLYRPKGEV